MSTYQLPPRTFDAPTDAHSHRRYTPVDAPDAEANHSQDLIVQAPNEHRAVKYSTAALTGAIPAAFTFAGVHHEVIRHWNHPDPRVAAVSIGAGAAALAFGIGYGLGFQAAKAGISRWSKEPPPYRTTAQAAAKRRSNERYNEIRYNTAMTTGALAALTGGPVGAYYFVTKVVANEPNLNDGTFVGGYASSQQGKSDVYLVGAIFLGAFAGGALLGAAAATAVRGCVQSARE